MEGTVRGMLELRGVRLSPAEGMPNIIGFRCLGLAEKIPEFESETGSLVHIWHVPQEILPVSISEAERWLVDAPPGRHWILSEREFTSDAHNILSKTLIEFWGPEKLARWIGESVLRGELIANIPPEEDPNSEYMSDKTDTPPPVKRTVLLPKINLDEWLIQRGLEHVDATPVLLLATIWNVNGSLISPDGEVETRSWRVLEDPWASKLELHDESEMMDNSPQIKQLKPFGQMWLNDTDLRTMLTGILETRRQKEDSGTGVVRSTMLEKWGFDSQSADLERIPAAVPGWLLKKDGVNEILHSRNGRIYEFNFSEEP